MKRRGTAPTRHARLPDPALQNLEYIFKKKRNLESFSNRNLRVADDSNFDGVQKKRWKTRRRGGQGRNYFTLPGVYDLRACMLRPNSDPPWKCAGLQPTLLSSSSCSLFFQRNLLFLFSHFLPLCLRRSQEFFIWKNSNNDMCSYRYKLSCNRLGYIRMVFSVRCLCTETFYLISERCYASRRATKKIVCSSFCIQMIYRRQK